LGFARASGSASGTPNKGNDVFVGAGLPAIKNIAPQGAPTGDIEENNRTDKQIKPTNNNFTDHLFPIHLFTVHYFPFTLRFYPTVYPGMYT